MLENGDVLCEEDLICKMIFSSSDDMASALGCYQKDSSGYQEVKNYQFTGFPSGKKGGNTGNRKRVLEQNQREKDSKKKKQ
jgi:hypothetical protein